MTIASITRALAGSAPAVPPGARKLRIYDDRLPGFTMEVAAGGRITFWLRYSDERHRRREVRLGRFGDVTVDQARRRAQELRAAVALGGDPAADRDRRRAEPSLAQFVGDRFVPFIEERLRGHADYTSMCRLRILPALGRLALDEVTPGHVAGFRRGLIAEGLSNARVNRHLSVLRRIFNLAIRWQALDGRNPAAHPGMLREEPRERYLVEAELRALAAALDRDRDRPAASAVLLLALTGARKSEILNAEWQHVDPDRRVLTVPLAKSGRRRHVLLSDAALRVLLAQPRPPGATLVFPSARRPGRPLEDVRGVWQRAKAAAGLPGDLRLHDLRHSFASLLINRGSTLHEVGRLLGHSQIATTTRYAHLDQGRLLDAIDLAGRIAGPGATTDASVPTLPSTATEPSR